MMKSMRENTKVILWIVVAAFVVTIFAVWGLDLQTGNTAGGPGILGKVNGVSVTPQLFQSVYNQLVQQYRQSAPNGQLTATQQDLLRETAWNNIVNNILTGEQIKKLGITVSDQEVLSFLRNSPPPEVQQYFQTEQGTFDYAAYQAALNNPEADWTGVEQLARERIPMIKLNQYLSAQVHVGAWEVRRQFEAENLRMVARYVRIPIASDDAPDIAPTEDEIQSYYDAHHGDYLEPERAVVDYVRIPITPTPGDSGDLDYTIRSIHDQISAGEEFGTMARTYSEAFTARTDGDAGFIGDGQRPEPVMQALESLADGAVAEPVLTDDGAYIVKRVGVREVDGKTEYHIQEIFVSLTAGSATRDSLGTLARDLRAAAEKSSLEEAATARGLSVDQSDPFARDAPVGKLGLIPSVSRFAFQSNPGDLSNVVTSDDAFYVVRLSRRLPEAVPPLDEIRERVTRAVVESRRVEAARHKADAFARAFRNPGSEFAATAGQYGLAVETTDTFTVQSPAGVIPAASPFHWAALEAPVGRPTPAIEGRDAFYVLEVTWRTDFDADAYQTRAPALRQRMLSQKTREYVSWWFDNLRADAKIQDFRDVS